MIDFLVVYLIFEGNLSNHFVILIENNVRCMFQAQIMSPEPASPFSSGRTSNGRSESKESKTRSDQNCTRTSGTCEKLFTHVTKRLAQVNFVMILVLKQSFS